MLCWLNESGEGLSNKVLLEWVLDLLHSLEDWRWLWSPEPATTPSLSLTLPNPQQPPLSYNASSANPWTTYASNSLSISAPSAKGLPPDILSTLAPYAHSPSVESSGMWAPVVQLQPWHAAYLSLPEWVTSAGFESVPQRYKGGNVTVEEC